MTNYRLINPHIRQVSLDNRNLEVLISHVTDGISPFSCEYLQTTDIELINKFKPYIIIKDGGLSKNKETIIPIELNILENFKIAVFDMQGDFVIRFEEDGYPLSSSVGVTDINGVGYIEIIPYHETDVWWVDQQADSTIILDDLNPDIYHEIKFICKYNFVFEKYEDGWNPETIGDQIKSLFFIKYDQNLFPTFHVEHKKLIEVSQSERKKVCEDNKERYVGYDIPDLDFIGTKQIGQHNCYVKYEANNLVYPILLFPSKGSLIFPYEINSKQVSPKGVTETLLYQKLKSKFSEISVVQYNISDNILIKYKDLKFPLQLDIAIIGNNDSLNIRIDIEIDEPYTGDESRDPIHFIGGRDEERNKRLNSLGWIIIRFSEFQVQVYTKECVDYICYLLSQIDSSFIRPSSVNEENLRDDILDKDNRWTKEQSEEYARQKYREKYLNHTFKHVESETFNLAELVQSDEERLISKKIFQVRQYENKLSSENLSANSLSKEEESFYTGEQIIKEHRYSIKGIVRFLNNIKNFFHIGSN